VGIASRKILTILLAGGCGLLALAVALLCAGRLLAAMGDAAAAAVVDGAAVVAASLLGIDLIATIFVQGFLLLSLWEEAHECDECHLHADADEESHPEGDDR